MGAPVKKGMLLRHDGHLFVIEDVTEHHSGKQKPVVHVALRDIRDNRHLSRTLDELQPLQPLQAGYRVFQYLFHRGQSYVFMDSESFEETELTAERLEGMAPFLREGQELRVMVADGQIARVLVPDNVVLKVADTAAPTHAVGGAGNTMKEARLENGLEARVPLFIRAGDTVKIDTRTRDYLGKAAAE